MNPKDFVRRLVGLVALVLYFNIFFFHRLGPVSFGLGVLGLFAFLIFNYWSNLSNWSNRRMIIGFKLSILWGIVILATRTNGLVDGIYYWFNMGLLGYLSYLLATNIPFFRSLLEFILSPLNLFISYAGSGLKLFLHILSGDLFQARKGNKKLGRLINVISPIVIGIIIALPVIFILVTLLKLADPIYASYVNRIYDLINNIFQGHFWIDLTNRSVWSAILLVIFSPYLLLIRKKDFHPPFYLPKKDMLLGEMTVVMSLVAVVLGSFIFIEWPYIFAKVAYETDLSKFGVATYSEYVKKGFGEMLVVSLFVYGLVWMGLYILRNRKFYHVTFSSPLFSIQMIIFAEFFLFILSIFRRVWLYQSYHGWSLGRIYGLFILVWIIMMTLFVFLRHFFRKRWIIYELLISVSLIVYLGIFNAESFIVNTHPPTVNKKVDYVYLSRMSPDGYEGWKKAYGYAKQVLMDENWKSKTKINRDDRREIAYAGMITKNLLYKYQNLVENYGTANEISSYYHQLFLNISHELDEAITLIPKNSEEDHTYQRLKAIREVVGGDLKKLENPYVVMKEISENMYYGFIPGKMTFNLANPNDYLFYGFYIPDDQNYNYPYYYAKYYGSRITESKIDKIFDWNFGRNKVYNLMKEEINYRELISLQNRYFELYKRVATKNLGDIDYDTDISFDTPFLERI